MILHLQLFKACVETLPKQKQIKFLASYFETTERHASWLLDSYHRYIDECHSDIAAANLAARLDSFSRSTEKNPTDNHL